MSRKVLLINEAQIKSQSVIESNVDAKILAKTIDIVQETKLKSILGSALYKDILNDVYEFKVNIVEIPELHKELLEDYVQPYLIHAVIGDYLVLNNYKVTNKGLLKLRDDAADNLSSQELEQVKDRYENYATTFKLNLIEFMKEKKLLVPSADVDIVSTGTGWFLRK